MTFRSLLALLSILALGCADPDENPRKYSAGSVRWGTACASFTPIAGSSFAPTDEPCIELLLEGYYTRGDLTAVYYLDDRELGRSRVEFSPVGALIQSARGNGAESRVTFQLHHAEAPLPISDRYRVVMERAGTEVARYGFEIAER